MSKVNSMPVNCAALDFGAMFPRPADEYDRFADVKEVEQVGGLDLRKALANRVVPGQIADNLLPPNCLAEPGLLMPRPKDVFERMRQMKYVADKLSETDDTTLKHMAEKSAVNLPSENAPAAE